MNKTTKYLLIGGSILALGLVAFLVLKPKSNEVSANNKPKDNEEDGGYEDDGGSSEELSFDEIELLCRYPNDGSPNYEKYCN